VSDQYTVEVDPTAENNPHSHALRIVGGGHRVLEVGCSTGYVTEHLVAAGNTVTGIDIDPEAAELAERFATRVHVADLDLVPASTLTDERFDVIVLGDVLEHLRDPDAALADLLTLLTDDGRVVVSVPNVAHADLRLLLLEGRWTYQETGLLDRTHLRFFTRSSLRGLLADAGLTATRLERVVIDPFTSGLPVAPAVHGADVLAFVAADPDSRTFQFVVEARRTEHLDGAVDVLAAAPRIDWPRLEHRAELDAHRARVGELERENAALRDEVEAWHNAKIVRLTRPLRAVWGRARRMTRR
jgi:2-polyprenyl-3-methyl-5-hydroxy-6-metoxy-1,4-benzoquinol methylase